MTDCVFCRVVEGAIPARRVYEDVDLIAFEDISPVSPTHVLVVPRRHIASLDAAVDADAPLLGRMIWVARNIAAERGLGEGYRLVMNVNAHGGQTVPHIHLHLLGGRPFLWPPG
jgi:histidine triad (HIT) family protein